MIEEIKICSGCGRLSNNPLGLNDLGVPYVACCPDNNYVELKQGEWFKDGTFWREWGHEWEKVLRGIHTHGLGDLIHSTCSKIIDDDDKSEWAYDALDACFTLLLARKRWPDRLNGIESKNYIEWRWERIKYKNTHLRGEQRALKLNWLGKIAVKLGYKNLQKYRPQGNMTRDPYIAFFACCLHLGLSQLIEPIIIPWHLWSQPTFNWRKRLIHNRHPRWVQRLGYYRAIAVKLNYERQFEKP
jgi:hypothetical protein